MKAYGSAVPAPRSTRDHGPPLPTRTRSGRDVWADYQAQGSRVSPLAGVSA